MLIVTNLDSFKKSLDKIMEDRSKQGLSISQRCNHDLDENLHGQELSILEARCFIKAEVYHGDKGQRAMSQATQGHLVDHYKKQNAGVGWVIPESARLLLQSFSLSSLFQSFPVTVTVFFTFQHSYVETIYVKSYLCAAIYDMNLVFFNIYSMLR